MQGGFDQFPILFLYTASIDANALVRVVLDTNQRTLLSVCVYVDTSLLTAYYCPESDSSQSQAYLAAQSHLAISWLTETELISALSKKVRARAISANDAQNINELFQAHIDAGSYAMLPIEASDFRRANRLLGRIDTNLRTLDALHLVVSLRENKTLATADAKLAAAAERLGGSVNFIDYTIPDR